MTNLTPAEHAELDQTDAQLRDGINGLVAATKQAMSIRNHEMRQAAADAIFRAVEDTHADNVRALLLSMVADRAQAEMGIRK